MDKAFWGRLVKVKKSLTLLLKYSTKTQHSLNHCCTLRDLLTFKDVIYNQPVRGYFLQQWVSCASQADATFSESTNTPEKNRLCCPFPVVTVRFFSQSRAVHGGCDLLLIHGCCSGWRCLVLSPAQPDVALCEAGSLCASAGARETIHNSQGSGQGRGRQGLWEGGPRHPMKPFLDARAFAPVGLIYWYKNLI